LPPELGLNAVIHQRDSWDDTLAILREFTGRVRGVFHCFGGTLEQAREVIALGHLVSFTGIVTFKNARQVQATAQDVPFDAIHGRDRLPLPRAGADRGKRCEPAHTRWPRGGADRDDFFRFNRILPPSALVAGA
jgi:TatD DNase family protein